jgi:hypothetical protein
MSAKVAIVFGGRAASPAFAQLFEALRYTA